MSYLAQLGQAGLDDAEDRAPGLAPGKVSLTQRMPARTLPPPTGPGAVVQARGEPGAAAAPDDPFAVHLGAAPARAEALPDATAARLGAAFGIDLASVRVHADSGEATALGAQAFARGDELHFAPGRYDGGAASHLVAHEVAHLVQQAEGRVAPTVQAKGAAINDSPALEAEADRMADAALAGHAVRTGPLLQPRAAPVAQGYFTHYGKPVDAAHADVVAARQRLADAGATGAELARFDAAVASRQPAGRLAAFRDGLLASIRARRGAEARRAEARRSRSEPEAPEKRPLPQEDHAPKRLRRGEPEPSSEEEQDEVDSDPELPDRRAASDEESNSSGSEEGSSSGSEEGSSSGSGEGESSQASSSQPGPDLDDYYAASQMEESSEEPGSEDERDQPRPRQPAVLGPRARGGALPNMQAFTTGAMKTQIGKQSRAVDKAADLQALSRLAHLIESVSSGTTCGAVVLSGSTLFVAANSAGKAVAVNALALLGALMGNDFDTPLDQLDAPDGVTAHFGRTEVTDDPVPKTSKVVGKSALELATEFRKNELAFTSATKKAEVAPQAAVDARRRLDATAAWLDDHPIDRIVVHDGAANEKHAEMRLLDAVHRFLTDGGTVDAPITLGISKLCCGMCILGVQLFRALHADVTVEVQGTHTNTYGKWPVPDFVTANLDRFASLAATVKSSEFKAHVQGDAIQEPLRGKLLAALSTVKVDGPQGKDPERPRFHHHTNTEYWSDGESSSG